MKYLNIFENLACLFLIGVLTSIPISLYLISKEIKELKTNTNYCTYIPNVKSQEMRVTGYIPTGKLTALGENVIVGYTAAISPQCAKDFLGEKVYIKGIGIRKITDLTASWVGEKYDLCTLDIAVPTEQDAFNLGNSTKEVIKVN